MNILVTAGNTQAMIDRVRCITNIFTGRTGALIAREAWSRRHRVKLLTSHPEAVLQISDDVPVDANWSVEAYRTFDELRDALQKAVARGEWDAVVHCAAVSDYLTEGVYANAGSPLLVRPGGCHSDGPVTMVSRSAAKVNSDDPELWLRLVRAPKIIDLFRNDWKFRGVLVKFKLEVSIGETELIAAAEKSRLKSGADLMIANTLEGVTEWALLGAGMYERVSRAILPARLLDAIERLVHERA